MSSKNLDSYERTTIQLKNKVIVLILEPFDTDVDMDDFTKIHYHNIMGEILTCSVALNRIGNLLAEFEALLSESQLDFDIFYAHQEEKFRKDLVRKVVGMRGGEKLENPTNTEIEYAIQRTPEFKAKKMHMISLVKNRDIIKSFYWAVHSKNTKLEKISEKLRPDEFEKDLIEEKINGVYLRVFEKAAK